MSREIEDRLRAALSARADRVGEDDLRPSRPPGGRDSRAQSGRFRRSLPWLAPVLAAAVVVVVVLGVTNGLPDRRSASNSSAAGRSTTSRPAPITTPMPVKSGPPSESTGTAKAQGSEKDASLPPPAITVPEDPTSGKLKPLPDAVLGSAGFWPAGNTQGFGQPHPSELDSNGDLSGIVLGITWQDWGLSSATGVGRTYLPKPDGGYYAGTVPVELQATKIGRCGSAVDYQQLYFRTPTQPGGPLTGPWQLWASADNLCRTR